MTGLGQQLSMASPVAAHEPRTGRSYIVC